MGASGTALGLEIEEVLSFGRGRFAIQPQLDTTTFYTDNLFFTDSANQVADVGNILSPGIRLKYGYDEENHMILDYGFDRFLYLDNSQADTTQHRLDYRLRFQKGRVSLRGSSSYHLLSGFLGGAINTFGQIIDQELIRNEYRVTWDTSRKTDVYVEADQDSRDYKQRIGILDVANLTGSLGASYGYSDRLRFFGEGFYGISEVRSNQAAGGTGPNSEVFGGFVGARGSFSSKLSGSLKVGYEQRVFASGQAQSASTPAVLADISYAVGPLTLLQFRYDRRTAVGPQFVRQTMVRDIITLQVNQSLGLGGRWVVGGNLSVGRSELSDAFRTVEGIGQVNVGRQDSSFGAGVSVQFRPREWMRVVLAYQHQRFDVDYKDPNADRLFRIVGYDANRVTLSMSLGY